VLTPASHAPVVSQLVVLWMLFKEAKQNLANEGVVTTHNVRLKRCHDAAQQGHRQFNGTCRYMSV
jgi:hypothetical protein